MALAEFCMLLLACAILALVYVLTAILQEHRLQSATQANRAPHLPTRNASPRHSVPDSRINRPGTSQAVAVSEVAPRSTGLRERLRSPALPSAQSIANAFLSGVPSLAFPAASRSRDLNASIQPSSPGSSASAAGPSTSPTSRSTSAAGPSASRPSRQTPAAGPSASRPSRQTPATGSSALRPSLSAPIAGPSTLRRPLTTSAEASPALAPGASVPWSPKKGWTSTCRINGVTYHRTEKKMRPRKSFKAGSEEPELVITPYWEPESVAACLIDYPPDLSGDPNLAVGDVFIFHTATHYRLWIHRPGGLWERVEVGFQREDGRFLIVTPVKKEPSWVSREYFERQTRQPESDSD